MKLIAKGAVALTSAAVVSLLPATAFAGTAGSSKTAPVADVEINAPGASAQARWYTLRHEALGPGKRLSAGIWKRPSGVRVMQVKARCWGNDSRIRVDLVYRRRYALGDKTAKSGTWSCNGGYGIVRIHNAGHRDYYANFILDKKHTVEYWVQYYK
ncbi:hypothetical protein Plo01_76050 [Planobispora longispora]|uniref:Uncharacterized protein n=1 Tax=Planobispora longispora TaxID=28887 RepID=A0A8J3RQR8_9ACTN|nr:hypothetical protein GCM10020093_107880 [Planobispora longispora]GIH81176.1 hypothetical protein Plo01_76050 [Planobispora longispora]